MVAKKRNGKPPEEFAHRGKAPELQPFHKFSEIGRNTTPKTGVQTGVQLARSWWPILRLNGAESTFV